MEKCKLLWVIEEEGDFGVREQGKAVENGRSSRGPSQWAFKNPSQRSSSAPLDRQWE